VTDAMPREFVGTAPTEVKLCGETFRVSPLTMGQLYQLLRFFRTLSPPEPVVVEVRGLVEAMLRPDPAGNGHAPSDPMQKLTQRLMNPVDARKEIIQGVLQAVRESRGRQEKWPPDPTSPLGQELIISDERVQKEFTRIVLAKYHPDLTAEDITSLLENADVVEYLDLVEAAFLTVRLREQKQARENMQMLGEMAQDPKLRPLVEAQIGRMIPDMSFSGGDDAGSQSLLETIPSTGLSTASS
jgi:hypothetical protein